jgi:hypothetical protein
LTISFVVALAQKLDGMAVLEFGSGSNGSTYYALDALDGRTIH